VSGIVRFRHNDLKNELRGNNSGIFITKKNKDNLATDFTDCTARKRQEGNILCGKMGGIDIIKLPCCFGANTCFWRGVFRPYLVRGFASHVGLIMIEDGNHCPEPNSTDAPKPERGNVQYFQAECPHDPCLRCNPYCPYCGDQTVEVK
jgi:hypothetical protein